MNISIPSLAVKKCQSAPAMKYDCLTHYQNNTESIPVFFPAISEHVRNWFLKRFCKSWREANVPKQSTQIPSVLKYDTLTATQIRFWNTNCAHWYCSSSPTQTECIYKQPWFAQERQADTHPFSVHPNYRNLITWNKKQAQVTGCYLLYCACKEPKATM